MVSFGRFQVWLVLFESLYWKKSFKLLFRETGNWNSQIDLRQHYWEKSSSNVQVNRFSSNSHWEKYFGIVVGTLFVESAVRAGIYFAFSKISFSEFLWMAPLKTDRLPICWFNIFFWILAKILIGRIIWQRKEQSTVYLKCLLSTPEIPFSQTWNKPFFAMRTIYDQSIT